MFIMVYGICVCIFIIICVPYDIVITIMVEFAYVLMCLFIASATSYYMHASA